MKCTARHCLGNSAMQSFEPDPIIYKILNPLFVLSILFSIGVFGLYFSTIIRNPYTILYPLILMLAPLLYYLGHSYGSSDLELTIQFKPQVILVLFFVTLFLLQSQYYISGFNRTAEVFYLTFALYLLSIIYALTSSHPYLGLLTIFIAGFTNRITAYYNTSLYVGVDIYTHSRSIEVLLDGSLGSIASAYYYSPFYHLFAAIGQFVFSVPTRDAVALTSLIAVTLLPLLIVYILTTQFWSEKWGLIAGFLYISSDQAIGWGIHVIPTTLGVVFFAILAFCIIQCYLSIDYRHYLLMILFLIALSFTHQVSLFIGMAALLTFSLGIIVYRLRVTTFATVLGALSIIVVFIDFIVTRYGGPDHHSSFFDVVLGNFISSLITAGVETRAEATFPDEQTISPTGAAALDLIQVAGSGLLLLLAIVGALFWLFESRANKFGKHSTRYFFTGFILSTITTVFLIVILAGPMIGLRNLLPSRWWAFVYILMAILAAPGLIFIASTVSDKQSILLGILIILIVPYTVLMVGVASSDSPFFDDAPDAERLSITESEKQLMEFTVNYEFEGTDYRADRRMQSYITRYYGTEVHTVRFEYPSWDIVHNDSVLFLARDYINTHTAQFQFEKGGQQFTAHGTIPINHVTPNHKSTIYNSGNDRAIYIDG